jgi:hypothetical protein
VSAATGWLLAAAAVLGAGHAPARRVACAMPEHRQFDFWLGDWDAFEAPHRDSLVARTRVDLILDGCVLREVYEGRNGLTGQSFSLYDAARRRWHQSWVTNRGQLLELDGGMDRDRMVLAGPQAGTDGGSVEIRGVWSREGNGVRETAETSADGGKTWKPLFDLVFLPHRP